MNDNLDFSFPQNSRSFITRDQGISVRTKLVNMIKDNFVVVVDFDLLETITPSFVDEFLGVIAKDYGKDVFKSQIKLKCSNREWKTLINKVISMRLHESNRIKSPEKS